MKYLPLMSEEEVRYICSVIPIEDSVGYFKKYPKDFAKILPGFRAKSVKSQEQASVILFKSRNQAFISFFLEKHISNWLAEIKEHLDKCVKDSFSKESAYLQILPLSFFAGNIPLYLKLIQDKRSDEYVVLLSSVTAEMKDVAEKQKNLQMILKSKEAHIDYLKEQLNSTKLNLDDSRIKLNGLTIKIKMLNKSVVDVDKFFTAAQKADEVMASLKSKIHEQENIIGQLKVELIRARNNLKQLEAPIRTELKKQQSIEKTKQQTVQKAKCPSNIEDFKEFLGYNFENIGIPTNSDFYPLLTGHLGNILFQGMPVVVVRSVGLPLIKCVANALIGQQNVKTLSFKNGILMDDVDRFLTSSGRVICLDNFIGNCDETELMPLFDAYKDKIFFLTVAYDGTLRYVSKELLRYAYYLNLNRIKAFSNAPELTEDPSIMEEVDCALHRASESNRFSNLLREILGEFSFPQGFIEQRCATISEEQDLCRILAFEVLPYCVDVLQIAPYNSSERFLKYAGSSGRCLCKKLFMEWFER